MKTFIKVTLVAFVGAVTTSGYAQPAVTPTAACTPTDGLRFVCGLEAVEDLVRVGNTRWLLGSGLGGPDRPGTLVRVDATAKSGEVLYPKPDARHAQDLKRFPDCKAPPDLSKFNAHGIAIRRTAKDRYQFYVVNHGGREAIEMFDIDARSGKPELTWVGCVPMPDDVSINSLDLLVDGGFIATHFYSPSKGGIGAVFSREVTGGLFEWHPGGKVMGIPGTELSGANGIALSKRGRVIHVAAWGTRELVRFERKGNTVTKRSVQLDFAADNLRWTSDGKLLIAGQKFVARREGPAALDGWTVAVTDPDTLVTTKLKEVDGTAAYQGVSSALEVGNDIWIGPFRGDRIAWFANPRRK